MKLSVVMPCFNEEKTLAAIVGRVAAADIHGLDREIILVDDCSTDTSPEIAAQLARANPAITVLTHDRNQGKSAALRTGFRAATGDVIIVQDADLEYAPEDFAAVLAPIVQDRADIVYGSRFLDPARSTFLGFTHRFGNHVLTFLSNRVNGLKLSDMSTCYKAFRRDVLDRITLEEARFGFCPEFTAKAARLKPRPRWTEVAVSYQCRTYAEGKKISWRHGVRAIYCILRYGLGC